MTEEAKILRGMEYPEDMDDPNARELQVTRMLVSWDVISEGTVTISADRGDPDSPFGFEFDVSASDAKRVAAALELAAERALR